MSIHPNLGGDYERVAEVYYKQNGQWRSVEAVHYNDDGTWKLVFPEPAPEPQIQPQIVWSLEEQFSGNQSLEDGSIPNLSLSADDINNEFNLNWNVFNDSIVDHYNVYSAFSSGGSYTKVNTTDITQKSFTDTNVNEGDVLYYVVTAVTNQGNETSFSNEERGELILMTVTLNDITTDLFPPYVKSTFDGEIINFSNVQTPFEAGFEFREVGENFNFLSSGSFNSTSTFSAKTLFEQSSSNSFLLEEDSIGTVRGMSGGRWIESRDQFVYVYENYIDLYNSDGTLVDSIDAGDRTEAMQVDGTDLFVGFFGGGFDDTQRLSKYDLSNNSINLVDQRPDDGGDGNDYTEIDVRSSDGQIAAVFDTVRVDIIDSNLNIIDQLQTSPRIDDISYRESDGYLATVRDDGIVVYNEDRTNQVFNSSGNNPSEDYFRVAFNNHNMKNSGYLAVGTFNGRVEIYDESFNFVGQTQAQTNAVVNAISWRPDGVVASSAGGENDSFGNEVLISNINGNTIQTIDTSTTNSIQEIDFHDNNFDMLALLEDTGDFGAPPQTPIAEVFEFQSELESGKTYEVRAITRKTANSLLGGSAIESFQTAIMDTFSINTLSAENIKTDSARLKGEVQNVFTTSRIQLSFEWGEQGNGLPNIINAFTSRKDTEFSAALFEGQQQLGQQISASQAGDLVRPVDWDPSTGRLAAGSNDNNLYIYDSNINLTNTISENEGDIRGVDWDKNSDRLAASSENGPVFIYDSNLSKSDTLTDSNDIATGIEWDESSGRLAVGSWDDTVYVYDSNLNLLQSLDSEASDNIFDVGWDRNNSRLAFGGGENKLFLYDSNLNFIKSISYNGSVISVDWDTNTGRLAVGTGEENVYIYNSNLIEEDVLRDPNQNVRGVSWDPTTGKLAVASDDNNAYIYSSNLNLTQTITDSSGEAIKVDWDEVSGRLALSSGDTNTYIYETNGLLNTNTTYEFRAVGTNELSSTTKKGSIQTFTTN